MHGNSRWSPSRQVGTAASFTSTEETVWGANTRYVLPVLPEARTWSALTVTVAAVPDTLT